MGKKLCKYWSYYFAIAMALVATSIITSLVLVYKDINQAEANHNIIRISSKWGQMEKPEIAMNESGDTILIWQDKGGQSYEIMSQLFDSYGFPSSLPLKINQFRPYDQKNPSVAMDKYGNFVVVWQSYKQDGSEGGIFGRGISDDGRRMGKEFRVNTYLRGNQTSPAIAMDEYGNFVVVWTSEKQDGSPKSIYAQRFNAQAERIGEEFRVNTRCDGTQTEPSVSLDNNGNFMIVWQSWDEDDWNIYGQVYDWDGMPVSEEDILINKTIDYNQARPDVTTLGNDKFIVVWENTSRHDVLEIKMENIKGQIYKNTGQKTGSEFDVSNPIAGHQQYPDIIQASSSKLFVVWQNYNKRYIDDRCWHIFGQALKTNGTLDGNWVMLSAESDKWNQSPAIASDSKGVIGVIWASLNDIKYKKALHFTRTVAI